MSRRSIEASIPDILEAMERGETVDSAFEGGIHLHIDRPLPFLALMRRPDDIPDPATEALLSALPTYLLAPSSPQHFDALHSVVQALSHYLHDSFGACLILECWLPGEAQEVKADFRIVAPRDHSPQRVLESLENELLRVGIHRHTPLIAVDYRDQIAPPGLPSLFEETGRRTNAHCTPIGLEVNPVYRAAGGGEVYTFAHRAFRRRFQRALKRAFFTYSHTYTTHRPAHYHELGTRTIEPAAFDVDARLAAISEDFDLLLHVTPVNAPQAWEDFRRCRFQQEVEFLYRPRTINPDLEKRTLYQIPIEEIDDPTLAELFSAKRDELDRQITLVANRNTPRFLLVSRQLFGDVSPDLVELATEILNRIPPTSGEKETGLLDAATLAKEAHRDLEHYRQRDPGFAARVEVRDDVTGIMVSHGNFLIGADARVPRRRLRAVLAHEVGTHALTYHNGRAQPFRELKVGMAGYEPFQEGLAVLAEYLAGGLDPSRLRQLAGRVIAVNMITQGADFIETFRHLHHQRSFTGKAAFQMTMRIFRGGGFTKDAVYLYGFQQVLAAVAGGQLLESLLLGKIAHEHLPLVNELRWRKILKEPQLLPRYLSLPQATERLSRATRGITIKDIIEESVAAIDTD